jgi:hypothetical protein
MWSGAMTWPSGQPDHGALGELTQPSHELRRVDLSISSRRDGLGLLDRVSPPPETLVDRAIREEGERLRRAFPTVNFDNPGARRSRSSGARHHRLD